MNIGRVSSAAADHPLVTAARQLLGFDIAVAGGLIEAWPGPLWQDEEPAIARAGPQRRQEFAAGRSTARRALSQLGAAACALPRRSDGPPVWPIGITGSITHGDGFVLAAAGHMGPGLSSLGLDLERGAELSEDYASEICRPDEDVTIAVQVFSAKEATYKAQFMLSGQALEFADLRVRFHGSDDFSAEFMVPAGPFRPGDRVVGSQRRIGSSILSAVRVN
ncbi:phosphopantetheinyl transferase [Rubellimicrobium rubrum]|uniref:4'-phosphopantetheinyl transferase family protein n=1 Tax=Rubellimicrobium rubrum TaxID=2585369 RepID=UPI00159BD880